MTGTVRPLRRWSSAAIARVGAALDAAFAGWAEAWDVAPVRVAVAPADRAAADGVVWHGLGAAAGVAWLGAGGDRRVAMRRFLAPDDRSRTLAPLAAAMAESAWTELTARLAEPLAAASPGTAFDADAPRAPSTPPRSDRRHWSGALFGRWTAADGSAVRLHLAEPAVRVLAGAERAPGRGAAIAPAAVRAALGAQRATLRAALTPVRIDVGSLLSLAPGDVLALSHPLERPLALRLVAAAGVDLHETPPLAFAALGARGRRRALTLLRPAPAPGPDFQETP